MQRIEGDCDRAFMRLDDARVIAHQGGDGHRLGWREREIAEHTPIGVWVWLAIRANLHPRGFLPQRQPFSGLRMKVLAEAQELAFACGTRQSQLLGSLPVPLPQDLLSLGVVIADT